MLWSSPLCYVHATVPWHIPLVNIHIGHAYAALPWFSPLVNVHIGHAYAALTWSSPLDNIHIGHAYAALLWSSPLVNIHIGHAYAALPWSSPLDNVYIGHAEDHCGPHWGHKGKTVSPAQEELGIKLDSLDKVILAWGLSGPPWGSCSHLTAWTGREAPGVCCWSCSLSGRELLRKD